MEAKVHPKLALRAPILLAAALAVLLTLFSGLTSFALTGDREEELWAERFCLWVLWSEDPHIIEKANAKLSKGEPFALVVRDFSIRYKKSAKTYRECLGVEELDPQLFSIMQDMHIGQVSRPISLAGGTALIFRTTDRHRREGRKLYRQHRYAEAEKALLKDLELHPDSSPVWHLLALCRAARGDKIGAIDALDQALKWSPADPNLLQDKATALVYMKKPAQAVPLYERALSIDPGSPVIMSNLAWALVLQGGSEKRALELAQKAADMSPDNGRMLSTLGMALYVNREYKKALKAYEHAFKLEPDLPGLKANLDKTKRALGLSAPKPATAAQQKPTAQAAAKEQPAKTKPAPAATPAPQAKAAPPAKAVKPSPPAKAPTPSPAKKTKPKQVAGQKPKAKQAASPQPQPQNDLVLPLAGKTPYLQVGTFTSLTLARKQQAILARAGYSSLFLGWKSPKGKIWKRVALGPFKSRKAALAMASMLKKKGLIHSYAVRWWLRESVQGVVPSQAALKPRAPQKARAETKLADAVKAKPTKPASPKAVRKPTAKPVVKQAVKQAVAVAKPKPPKPKAKPQAPRAAAPKKTPPKAVKVKPVQGSQPMRFPKGSTFVRVAAYHNGLKARREVMKWRRRGYQALVSSWIKTDGKVMHRILLGPYPNKAAALKAAKELHGRKMIGDDYRLMVMGPDPLN